jgi:hypothetical protein
VLKDKFEHVANVATILPIPEAEELVSEDTAVLEEETVS